MIPEVKEIMDELKERMDNAIKYLVKEYNAFKTGKASPALVEDIKVEYYGATVPLKQIASISVPDPRMIVIQPYDKSATKAIERAIQTSPLGITPNVDGNIIRLIIPKPTEERRRELVKLASKKAEEVRISIRQARRDAIEAIRKLEKEDKLISEDESERYQKEIEKQVKNYLAKVEEIFKEKEKEILSV